MSENKKENVEKWYDNYSHIQIKKGINGRHKKILFYLKKFGLKKNSRILEIGCGIGSFTSLVARHLSSQGSIIANDISSESIEIAKQGLSKFHNIEFLAGDFIDLTIDGEFDFIILPDVLEHIPKEQHTTLFKKLEPLLNPEGLIIINIPNPYYLEWCQTNSKEKLQVIDQPIFTNELANSVYPNNLFIDYLESYSIWIDNNDYQIIVLKSNIKRVYSLLSKETSNATIKEKIRKRLINLLYKV